MSTQAASMIQERLRQLQEQNEKRSAEAEEAEKAMAEGKYTSRPEVEQVKPSSSKKKKNRNKQSQPQTVSARNEDLQAEKEAREAEKYQPERKQAAESAKDQIIDPETYSAPYPSAAITETREHTTEPAREKSAPAELPEEISHTGQPPEDSQEENPKYTRETLEKTMASFESLLNETSAEEPFEEHASPTDRPLEKPEPSTAPANKPKFKGPHAIRRRTVKYVDLRGRELTGFGLIQKLTGEVSDLRGTKLIGKSESCDIRIDNRFVSRKHAIITEENGSFYIEDLNSTNGTFINGIQIDPGIKTRIEVGDSIVLADTELIFEALR